MQRNQGTRSRVTYVPFPLLGSLGHDTLWVPGVDLDKQVVPHHSYERRKFLTAYMLGFQWKGFG